MRDTVYTEDWLAERLGRMKTRPLGRDVAGAAKGTQQLESTPSKYRNHKTEVDGIVFASKKEANRYIELRIMQGAGQIRNLKTQVPFVFNHNDVLICRYYADFQYDTPTRTIVEDVKGGKRTKEYIIKKKLMRAFYAIEILET